MDQSLRDDLESFLERLREALELGGVAYTLKARREYQQIGLDEEQVDAVLVQLTADDWERDEAPWSGQGGLIRVFCPWMMETGELWIRVREEEETFFVIISFHPRGGL